MGKKEKRVPHPRVVANERYLANPNLFIQSPAEEERQFAGIAEHSAARFSEPITEEREGELVMVWTSNYVDPSRISMYAGYLGERHTFNELTVSLGVGGDLQDPNFNEPILIWQAKWNLNHQEVPVA